MKKKYAILSGITVLMILSLILGIGVEDLLKSRGMDEGQLYVSENVVGFREVLDSYAALCKSKNTIKSYREPYHGKRKNIDFIRKETSNSGDTTAYCQFYLQDLRVLVSFSIRKHDGRTEIIVYGAEFCMDSGQKKANSYSYAINDGYRHIPLDVRTLKSFREEVLLRIGSFKPDYLQGFLCRYYQFILCSMYFYGIAFLLLLFILLVSYRG